MAILSDLISRVRLETGDQPTKFSYTATGDGVTKVFTLNCKPVDPVTLSVTVNGTAQLTPTNYTLEKDIGVITFVTAPAVNAAIVVNGLVYRYFTDSDITTFVNDAVTQHSYNRTDAYGSQINISNIPAVEEYPVAILASIEALWALATDAAFDINVTAPDGVVIPRAQRYQQLTNIIQQRWDQYRNLCAQLNIGLWRIEMGTLRRVSRKTNKLVPVYMPQEIDDSRKPERLYLQNDHTGRTPLPEYAAVYDIALYQGNSWSQQFIFPFDITNLVFEAQIRTYPNAPSLYATFAYQITDGPNGVLTLSLDPGDTEYIPVRAFWDLKATTPAIPNFAQTYIQGQVFTTQAVTV